MQGGADDATGLLIAALTASAHAIGRGSEAACCTCEPQDGPTAAAIQAPILTNMVVSASVAVASVRMCCGSSRKRSTSGLLHILRAPHAGRSG